jgi:hypothetical protein
MSWRYRFLTDEWGREQPGGIAEAGEDASVTGASEVMVGRVEALGPARW